MCDISVGFLIQSHDLSLFFSFSRVLHIILLTFAIHDRIGPNTSLFSRERQPTWASFTIVLLFTGVSIFIYVVFFSLRQHRTSRNVSRVATVAPFYSGRRKMRARKRTKGIIIYIAVKPEFYRALSSGLNVTNPVMSKSSRRIRCRVFPFTSQRRLFAP